MLSFLGPYNQIPPMYSALKVDGKKLYELARAGKEVERKARPVEILEIQIESIELPRVTMTVSCSKGTYIRTLCYDIGKKLGCGGCMEELLRTRVGGYLLKDSLTLKQIEDCRDEGTLESHIMPVEQAFEGYPVLTVKPEYDKLVHNGNTIDVNQAEGSYQTADGPVKVYDSEGVFIGIYGPSDSSTRLKPQKVFLGGNHT